MYRGSQSGSRTFYLHQRQRDGLVQTQSHSLALGVEAVHVEEDDHSSVRVNRIAVVMATTTIPNDAAAGCVGWAGGGSAHVIFIVCFSCCASASLHPSLPSNRLMHCVECAPTKQNTLILLAYVTRFLSNWHRRYP